MIHSVCVGDKFGKLSIVSFAGRNKRSEKLWLCKCDCGGDKIVKDYNLRIGKTKSCGCLPTGKQVNHLEFVGKRFGKVVIEEFVCRSQHRDIIYRYLCDCGNSGQVTKAKLMSKRPQKSCHQCLWDDFEGITQGYWTRIQKNAESRNLDFELSREYAWDLFIQQKEMCAISGIKLIFARSWTRDQTASLDRIDSKKGYVEGNVQWVHKRINEMKMDHSNKELISWARKIVKYNS